MSKIEAQTINISNGIVRFIKYGKLVHCFVHIQHANPILTYPDNTPLANYPVGYVPNIAYMDTENAIISKESQGRQGDVRLVLRRNNVVVFGTSGKAYYEVKGTITYCVN